MSCGGLEFQGHPAQGLEALQEGDPHLGQPGRRLLGDDAETVGGNGARCRGGVLPGYARRGSVRRRGERFPSPQRNAEQHPTQGQGEEEDQAQGT